MPTLSMFYGIIIRMYFAQGEHPPPHFHVYYAEHKATVDIRTCEVIEGHLPGKSRSGFNRFSKKRTLCIRL